MLSTDERQTIREGFENAFLNGQAFPSIMDARKFAQQLIGRSFTSGRQEAKELEETIEQGIVGAAKQIIHQSQSPLDTFDQLVDLYQRQPRLGTRSSTSIQKQQYSTPVPLAYLALQLAGIDGNTTVYEPTAGHGALLMTVNPQTATVNELDDQRAADLMRQGFTVTQNDATSVVPEPRSQDVVIANPPFGRRRQAGRAEQFTIGAAQTPIRTSQLDHVIAWRSLEAMTDDGTAVLLIGSEKGSQASRSDKYNEQQNRGFFKNLYENYAVDQHFTVDGGLYDRQGAGFPIDVIRIRGWRRTQRRLPAADVPPVYESYDELKEVLRNALLQESPGMDAEPGSRRRDDLDATGQLLRGDRAPGQERDRTLRGLSGTTGSPDRLDDPAMERGSADVAEAGRFDDSPAIADGSGARFRDAATEPSDAGELGQRDRSEFLDVNDLDARSRSGAGGLSAADGSGREPPGRDRNGGGTDAGGVADVLREVRTVQAGNDMATETTQPTQPMASQVPYVPRSQGPRLDTLTPRNMASAVQSALDDLEGRVGNVDEFVARKLNYPSVNAMHQVLAAEQVDGVALSIDNIERGDGSLIGDQTGVGKGRQMAAMIRYAQETDRIPIFVTRDAGLYSDMIRDLDDIGSKGFRPFITNSQEKVPLPDGRTLETKRGSHAAELDRLIQQGGFAATDDYDGIFTTYSQMQTVKGKETPRRQFLDRIAPQSLILFDEAHEAGGSPEPENSWKKTGPPNRADFARQLVDKADGVTFSSATAIKRPDVMDLYGRRSGMRQAAGSIEELQSALEIGGTPLQQVSTNMLAQDGFYNRRERNYEGVDFGIQSVPVDRDSTDGLSRIMGKILEFDRTKQDALKGLDDRLKADAKKVGTDNSVGQAGADSTNFTAVMHNVMDQSLLSRKAGQMADEAIASLERGEKPILTVSNTMGSFIEHYANENDIAPGDAFDATFGDIMRRYLERSRDVLEKDYDGTQTRRRLSDEELGPAAVQQYEEAKALIANTDLDFPVSPIDTIKQRIEQAGYRFGEITGRKVRLDYDSEGNATYGRRSSRETSKAGKVRATDRFNDGKTDVMLLNRSGATGISLHASKKFADQRRRHMIVGQAERNVNDFMQTLGRAHRTGQVVPPRISLLMGDTPDEKRPAALLERKMSSLNANTTADKNAGFDTSQIPDFFNQYGDAVVEQVLSEYPEINEKLDYPITVNPDGVTSLEDATEGAIAKVTGRLPLLSVDEQEAFYSILEDEYTSFVKQQKALDNNILEAEAVDLDARPLAQAEIISAMPGVRSTFGSGVQVEVVDAKAQSKPKTQLEVINEIRAGLDLDPVESPAEHDAEGVDRTAQAYTDDLLAKAGQAAERYLAQQTAKIEQRIPDPEKQQTALNRASRRLDKQQTQLTQLQRFRPGQTVRLSTENGRIFYGAISGVSKRGTSLDKILAADAEAESQNRLGDSNPVAPSKWMVNVSLADSSREIPLPLSKINVDRIGAVDMTPVQKTMMGSDVMALFDERQAGEREVRQVLRGNLLRASEKYGKDGNVVNATMSTGGVEPMLLLPRGYDLQQQLSESPVVLPAARNVRQFMEVSEHQGIVKTSDEQITLKAAPHADGYLLQTGKKQKDVYLDEDLMAAVGDEFYSISDRMEAAFPADRLEEVVSYIQDGRHQRLEATTHLGQARELVGEKIPEFSWSDSVENVIETAGLAPSVDLSNLEAVRAGLESALQQAEQADWVEVPDHIAQNGLDEMPPANVSEQSEPASSAYRLDPEGPTTIGRERARLLNRYSDIDSAASEEAVEQANAIAYRDDQLETLADEYGEDARISFSDPTEQDLAVAAQDVRDPDQPNQEEATPATDEPSPDEPVEESLSAVADRAQEPEPKVACVGGWTEQSGQPEKYVGKLLEEAGLSQAVMADQDFYLKVENEPFIPLNIERHGEQLMLYHTLVENGDAYIDSEMVFNLSDDGSLNLAETAVHNPIGESRGLDRAYAGMFARNLRQQGFAEAIQQQLSVEPEPEPSEAAPAPDNVRSQMADSPDEQTAQSVTEPSNKLANALSTDVAAQTVEPSHTEDLGNERPSLSLSYQETLERLRGVVQDLPDAQRESVLSAINQAEEQMASDPETPLNPSTGTVAAGAFIQNAIAQNDPDLDQQLAQPLETQQNSPTIEQFRNWYRAARTLGRSDQELANIEAMGKSAKAGELKNLASSDAQQMAADLSAFEQQRELGSSILNHARRFLGNLEAAGLVQRDENGTIEARGRQYTVRQTPKGLSVAKNDHSAGVSANSEGNITQVANLTEADKQNWQTSASRSPRNLRSLYQKRQQRQPSVKSQAKEASGVEL
ncbi:MAG: strawberry notch C-terminal domain-containing protein [Thainema sp.]